MARFAPFETAPAIGLAVSGGADSMALAALGQGWATSRGGVARALVVDHGLRSGSGAEARTVAERCRALGLETDILVWAGAKPSRGIQEAARRARYDLLAAACKRANILHLLVAHHRDDQVETVALRQERASGAEGLAGMTALAEWRDLRLLRPLLDVAKARLVATARAHGLAWVEDPSNADPIFARTRLRAPGRALPTAAAIRGHQERRLAGEARRIEDLVACATMHPAGFAVLDRETWRNLASERRSEVVSRLAMTVGGLAYPPRGDRLSRFLERLCDGREPLFATFGRCLWQLKGPNVLVRRESRHLPTKQVLVAGECVHWDGRFLVSTAVSGLSVAPLGAAGWRSLREAGAAGGLPSGTAPVLPAFYDLEGLAAVPYFQWQRANSTNGRVRADFAPHHALAAAGFVASMSDDPQGGQGEY